MSKSTVDVSITYPKDGREYREIFYQNYDAAVTAAIGGGIDIKFKSKQKPLSSAKITVAPQVARWLGLALLRASLQSEQEQRLEVRDDRFPNDNVA